MKNRSVCRRGTANNQKILQSRFGTFNLAKEADRQRLKKTVVELQRQTDALTRKDIGDWRRAWQMAINVDNPNRQRLYDIYTDVDVDLHLSGCIQQREGFVLARSFKLVDDKGKENEEAAIFFAKPWFKQLMRYALDANYWGHSLIGLGDLTTDINGRLTYDGVRLVPRKHVIPEYNRVIPQLGQDWRTGIDYHQPPYCDWLIEVGQPNDLGLFLKAATQTIPKKNALAFWDTFAEIFGMPMRIAHTTTRDEKELAKMEKMLDSMGAAMWGMFQDGTDIEVVESTKGDAFNVYDKRVDRANSELSKLIIGQTMTIEDGSSLSQSQTHLEVFQNLVDADRDMLCDIINEQLIPRMIRHGFPLQGLHFLWDDTIDYTPEQQKAVEEMALNHFEVEGSYFRDKYGIPVGNRLTAGSPNGGAALAAPVHSGGAPADNNRSDFFD